MVESYFSLLYCNYLLLTVLCQFFADQLCKERNNFSTIYGVIRTILGSIWRNWTQKLPRGFTKVNRRMSTGYAHCRYTQSNVVLRLLNVTCMKIGCWINVNMTVIFLGIFSLSRLLIQIKHTKHYKNKRNHYLRICPRQELKKSYFWE